MRLLLAIAAAIAWLAAGTRAEAQPAHPLAGKIVDTRSGVLTDNTDAGLIPKLFPCGAITLLGEVHDNAAHHRMRGDLVRRESHAARTCTSPSFVMEHLSADQQPALDNFRGFQSGSRQPANAADFFRMVEWDKSGWPSATIFAPLVEEVIASRRGIYPGNPPRATTRSVAKEGLSALDTALAEKHVLTRPLEPALLDNLLGELEAGHCGLMPRSAFGSMAMAQRLRDATMADAALTTPSGVIILAGNGHVRADRGVPWYIRQRAPERTVVTVAFVETEDGKTDPMTYGPKDPTGKPATDYVAFAAPAQREDPCEQMRKHMKKQ